MTVRWLLRSHRVWSLICRAQRAFRRGMLIRSRAGSDDGLLARGQVERCRLEGQQSSNASQRRSARHRMHSAQKTTRQAMPSEYRTVLHRRGAILFGDLLVKNARAFGAPSSAWHEDCSASRSGVARYLSACFVDWLDIARQAVLAALQRSADNVCGFLRADGIHHGVSSRRPQLLPGVLICFAKRVATAGIPDRAWSLPLPFTVDEWLLYRSRGCCISQRVDLRVRFVQYRTF